MLKEATTSLSLLKLPQSLPYTKDGIKNNSVNKGMMAFIRVDPSIRLPVSGFLIKEPLGIQQIT